MIDEVTIFPPRVEGRYMRPDEGDLVAAGCKTCGWYLSGTKDEVRQPWIDHTHDPIHDITERALSGVALVPAEDVLWLLDLLEEGETITELPPMKRGSLQWRLCEFIDLELETELKHRKQARSCLG